MKPQGLKPCRFPGKSSSWLGKRVRWWWETVTKANKRADREEGKRHAESAARDQVDERSFWQGNASRAWTDEFGDTVFPEFDKPETWNPIPSQDT